MLRGVWWGCCWTSKTKSNFKTSGFWTLNPQNLTTYWSIRVTDFSSWRNTIPHFAPWHGTGVFPGNSLAILCARRPGSVGLAALKHIERKLIKQIKCAHEYIETHISVQPCLWSFKCFLSFRKWSLAGVSFPGTPGNGLTIHCDDTFCSIDQAEE